MMGSDYYPPGVTGAEPQIAGPRGERVEHRACDLDTEYVPVHIVWMMTSNYAIRMTRLLNSGAGVPDGTTAEWAEDWRQFVEKHTAEFACDWEGEVELTLHSGGVATWDCPRCGGDHEEPDYGYDLAQDAKLEAAERARDRDFER